MLAGGPITWDSRKQKTIAQSSTEAEYMAASDCGKQIIWIESLCMELGFNIKPMILCVDNQGAIFAASNPVLHKHMKHIDIKYHAIQEWIKDEQIELQYISTEGQLADILTKSLPYERFKQLRNKIGLAVF